MSALPRLARIESSFFHAFIALTSRAIRAPRSILAWLSAARLRLFERGEHRREARSPTCLNRSENRAYPWDGKYEILEEIFRRIGTTNRFCVEIGCDDGGHCNSRRLIEADAWSGVLLDENPHDCAFAAARFSAYPVEVVHSPMRIDTVDRVLEAEGAPPHVDFLSVYIEGNDYWIWKCIGATRPRVVCILYNASHLPWKSWIMPYNPEHVWNGSRHFGASLRALAGLASQRGYSLVGCDRVGIHAFFVEDQLAASHFERPKDVLFHYRCPKYRWPWFGHPRTASNGMHSFEFKERTGRYPLFRPGSIDHSIWEGVAREYATVPRRFSAEDTVIDIGCHIGSFSALAALRGAGKVLAFEANRSNFAVARVNLSPFPQCELRNVAVWRSDLRQCEELLYTPSTDGPNTGGGSVLFEELEGRRRFGEYGRSDSFIAEDPGLSPHVSSHPVTAIALDDILGELATVRCLKIDAEGSEFPILLTSTLLDRVQEVVGEFHECSKDEERLLRRSAAVDSGSFRMEHLAARLRGKGFFVDWCHTGPRIGMFFACKDCSTLSRLRKSLAFYGIAG